MGASTEVLISTDVYSNETASVDINLRAVTEMEIGSNASQIIPVSTQDGAPFHCRFATLEESNLDVPVSCNGNTFCGATLELSNDCVLTWATGSGYSVPGSNYAFQIVVTNNYTGISTMASGEITLLAAGSGQPTCFSGFPSLTVKACTVNIFTLYAFAPNENDLTKLDSFGLIQGSSIVPYALTQPFQMSAEWSYSPRIDAVNTFAAGYVEFEDSNRHVAYCPVSVNVVNLECSDIIQVHCKTTEVI